MTTTLKLVMQLLPLLMEAESNFDPNVVNEKEDAVGILQITPIMVEDVNRIRAGQQLEMSLHCPYSLNCRYSIHRSVNMYFDFYDKYTKHFTVKFTMRDLSAMWCAGPDGYKQLDNPKVKLHWEHILRAKENQK